MLDYPTSVITNSGTTMVPAPQIPSIHVLMSRVMRDIHPVGKDGYNKDQGFKFRGIEAIVNALKEALVAHGVFYTPQVLSSEYGTFTTSRGTIMRTCSLRVQYVFFGPDGDYVTTVMEGESFDTGDKAVSKAESMALKYALVQTFNIPTAGVIEDADATSVESEPKSSSSTKTKVNPVRSPPAKKTADAEGSPQAPVAMRKLIVKTATTAGLGTEKLSETCLTVAGKQLDEASFSVEDGNKVLEHLRGLDSGREF